MSSITRKRQREMRLARGRYEYYKDDIEIARIEDRKWGKLRSKHPFWKRRRSGIGMDRTGS